MKLRCSLIVLTLISVMGCQTGKKISGSSEGQFKARALIKDTKEQKSAIVNLNFNVVRGKALRLDVTSPLSHHLASFVIQPKSLTYYIVPEKTYYSGSMQEDAMKKLLPIPFNPMWLENILFQEAFTNKDWSCTQDKSGVLATCMNLQEKLNVTWSKGEKGRLRVTMKHPRGEIQMNFHVSQPKVEEGVSLAPLKMPKGFRAIKG